MSEKITLDLDGLKVAVSNADKVFYAETGFTKGDVIDYYLKISSAILPHLRNRPVRLNHYPDGAEGGALYEKLRPSQKPAWIKTVPGVGPDRNKYCLLNDLRALVWAADQADLEFHPFHHRSDARTKPTVMVFDLDPGVPSGIAQCCRMGLHLKAVLETLKLRSFAKTSGSQCLQVYVPLHTPVTYARTRAFAKKLAQRFEARHPEEIVSRPSKLLPRGKVFLNGRPNDSKRTMVCVYSLRARRRPTVSTPVTWEEVARAAEGKTPLRFETQEVLRRVEKLGDLFAPVLKLRQKLPALTALTQIG